MTQFMSARDKVGDDLRAMGNGGLCDRTTPLMGRRAPSRRGTSIQFTRGESEKEERKERNQRIKALLV